MSLVLVTGGSGFVGGHVILQLLAAGHTVRTTLRSLTRETEVRSTLREAGADVSALSFVAADLERDDGWADAVSGCDYVMHVASPIPVQMPKSADDLIRPAREGTLRVLRAARDAGVKRVVFTSTCGAVYYGHPLQQTPFDETSWTNIDGETSDYVRSKALAERAAWDFMKAEGGALELAVVNPCGIFGPVLGPDFASSVEIIKRMLSGGPGNPQIYFAIVDVRDVADLHLRAMTDPAAAGERFIAVSGNALSLPQIARTLKERLGDAAAKVPTRTLPNWLVRFSANFKSELRPLLPLLGKARNATSAKAERMLGWHPRPAEETLVATAQSLIKFGIVR